ncbi:MAG: hypothetical protein LBH29_00225, partial [Elusimicrobiota bacterium]|nr:hypothetical protein [Elusimicrobiota bacterium]
MKIFKSFHISKHAVFLTMLLCLVFLSIVESWADRWTSWTSNTNWNLTQDTHITGYSYDSGGAAISVSNSVIDINTNAFILSFINNSAGNFGGAIYNSNSTMTFNNSSITFSGNAANSYDDYGDFGGAIANYNSIMTFNNSLITFSINSVGNTAYHYRVGGAIYNSYSTMTFNNSSIIFIGNNANGHSSGGAIANYNSIMTFNNSLITFSGNSVNGYGDGGAIANEFLSIMTFNNSSITFSGNSADDRDGIGGAITNYSSTITFNDSYILFKYNIAARAGGAIDNYYSPMTFNNSSVTFSNNNVAGEDDDYGGYYHGGGAIYNNDSTITFNDSYILFKGNIATTSGGAIFIYRGKVTMRAITKDIDFIGNRANGKPNDIHMSDYGNNLLELFAEQGTIRMAGGITSQGNNNVINNNVIKKQGNGYLIFGSKAIIKLANTDSNKFEIEAGAVVFHPAASTIGYLSIAGNAAIRINADFEGNRTSKFYLNTVEILPNAVLIADIVGGSSATMTAYISSRAFIYTINKSGAFTTILGGQYDYEFKWLDEVGGGYNWVGYLIYKDFDGNKQPLQPIPDPDPDPDPNPSIKSRGNFYANLASLGAKADFLPDNLDNLIQTPSAAKDSENAFWFNADFASLTNGDLGGGVIG